MNAQATNIPGEGLGCRDDVAILTSHRISVYMLLSTSDAREKVLT